MGVMDSPVKFAGAIAFNPRAHGRDARYAIPEGVTDLQPTRAWARCFAISIDTMRVPFNPRAHGRDTAIPAPIQAL